nr:DUF4142 domain-containing protein [uncultured Dyadobacter sp.]
MKKQTLLAFLGLTIGVSIGCENSDQPQNDLIAEADKQFIMASADETLFQVNAGEVVAESGASKAVRDYGQEMTSNHVLAGQALQALAAEKKLEIPTTLEDDRQQELDSLAMRTGVALDTLYLRQMVASHNRAIRLLEIGSTTSNDAGIKAWASERLPMVRQFADRAKALRDSLN